MVIRERGQVLKQSNIVFCPLGSQSHSVKYVSTSHEKQSARMFRDLLCIGIFNLYEKSSMDPMLTSLSSVFPISEFFQGFMVTKNCALKCPEGRS